MTFCIVQLFTEVVLPLVDGNLGEEGWGRGGGGHGDSSLQGACRRG